MDEDREQVVRRIFDGVMDLPVEQRRPALDRECAGDADLRRRLEAMIAAAEGDFLADPTRSAVSGAPAALREGPGTRIGRYKILQLIGEGGFGSVFMAEQEEPVRRKVALKVIKLGMDTKQVIARFEAERQALAMMDHPHIARVLDAGATEGGRPYFVMELVKGVPITEYCDANNLTARERLELFIPVCQAVQHAHHKGVIHRDIKPGNILVTLHDGTPVPKVIDFGIAKATDARLTEKTVFTEHRQMIGTPAYMSPEQAEMSGLDVDTRTDVYSLGVLLYELLTGTTPFTNEELMKAGYGEIQRIIREVEPPKPSTRVSTLGESLTAVAGKRKTDGVRLGVLLRGDLDWIVMRCLEKDRTRRYDTPTSLAEDVRRHLGGEAVVAAPPSVGYRVRKFVRRNRRSVVVTSLVFLLLVFSTSVVSLLAWQLTRTSRRAAADARAARLAESDALFQKAKQNSSQHFSETPEGPTAEEDDLSKAEAIRSEQVGPDDPQLVEMRILLMSALEYTDSKRVLALAKEVAPYAKGILEEEFSAYCYWSSQLTSLGTLKKWDELRATRRDAMEFWLTPGHIQSFFARNLLSDMTDEWVQNGDVQAIKDGYAEVIQAYTRSYGAGSIPTQFLRLELGRAMLRSGRFGLGNEILSHVRTGLLLARDPNKEHDDYVWEVTALDLLLARAAGSSLVGQFDKASAMLHSLAEYIRQVDPAWWQLPLTAYVEAHRGNTGAAKADLTEAIAQMETEHRDADREIDHRAMAICIAMLSELQRREGDTAGARELCVRAVEEFAVSANDPSPSPMMARAYYRLDRYAEAVGQLRTLAAGPARLDSRLDQLLDHFDERARLALGAMIDFKLGHPQKARDGLIRLRDLMSDPASADTWAKDADAKALLAEAEALIDPPAAPAPTK